LDKEYRIFIEGGRLEGLASLAEAAGTKGRKHRRNAGARKVESAEGNCGTKGSEHKGMLGHERIPAPQVKRGTWAR